jgi:hypothetical protein
VNQYQAQNAAYKIDGYYTPPRDVAKVSAAFEAAKAECLIHLRAAVAHVEQMQVAQFLKDRKGAPCAKPTGPMGEPCGLTAKPCPDCGPCLVDVGIGA